MADERARIDDGVAASDWNRGRTWDLYVRDGDGGLVSVTTVEQFLSVIGDLRLTPQEFMSLPAAGAMPVELMDALEEAGLITS